MSDDTRNADDSGDEPADAERIADAIDEIGVDRLSELIVEAWTRRPEPEDVADGATEESGDER